MQLGLPLHAGMGKILGTNSLCCKFKWSRLHPVFHIGRFGSGDEEQPSLGLLGRQTFFIGGKTGLH